MARRRRWIVILLVMWAVSIAIGVFLERGDAPAETLAGSGPEDAPRYQLVVSQDERGMGCEAFRVMVPDGWTSEGGVQWSLDRPDPARIAWKIVSPDGQAELRCWPNAMLMWETGGMTQGLAVGQMQGGWEHRPPVGAAEYIEQILIPRVRPEARDVRILEAHPVGISSRPAFGNDPSILVECEGASLRVQYTEGGSAFEELFVGTIWKLDVTRMTPLITWGTENLFSGRAPRGELERYEDAFAFVVRSFRMHPRWLSGYEQLVTGIGRSQSKALRDIGDLHDRLRRTGDEIDELTWKSWEARNRTQDALAQSWSENILDLQSYADPGSEGDVTLPGGYDHAYTDGGGNYVLSQAPLDGDGTWSELEPRP